MLFLCGSKHAPQLLRGLIISHRHHNSPKTAHAGGFHMQGHPAAAWDFSPSKNHPKQILSKGPGIWGFAILCPGSAGADAQDPKTGQ